MEALIWAKEKTQKKLQLNANGAKFLDITPSKIHGGAAS